MIDQLSRHESIDFICEAFAVSRSSYYNYRLRRRRIDVKRMALRSRVNELFAESRDSAGSRSIVSMMREEGADIGRFKVHRLMREWVPSTGYLTAHEAHIEISVAT